MEQTYMAKALIDVDVNSQKYQDFINTVEKKGATIKVNPDIDASKFLSKFEGLLRKHPEKLVIEADTSKINKSLSMVRGFVGKSGAEIGKSFSDSMKNGFDNVSFDKMVRESLKSGERISQKARASYIEDLNKTVAKGFNSKTGEFQINSKNYLEIEKIIDAYERLVVAKRELGTSTNKDILSALDNSSKYLKANPYKNIGNNIAENINDMVASVEKAQRSAVSKLENFQTEIANILSGKGVSGATSTGNSHFSDTLAKENEALKSQIAILEKNSTKLQDAQKRLEAASLKLSRSGHLKGRSKGSVNEEFSSALSAFISEGGTLNKDIVEQNESLRGTKYYTQIEKELLAAFNLITKPNAKSPKDTTSNDTKQKLLDSIKQAAKNIVSLYHRSLEDDDFDDYKLVEAYENFQKIGGSKKDLIGAFKSKYGKTRFKDEILDFSASMQQDFGLPGITEFLADSDKIQQEYLETAQAAQTAQKAIEESNKSLNKQKTLSQKSYTVSFYGNKKDAEAGVDSSLKLLPKAQSFISKKPKIDNITIPERVQTDSSQNVQKELSDITTLKNAVKNVTQAVNEKTAAFQNEQKVVSSVAISEKNSLELVEGAITNVANGANKISSSFQGERDEILAIINAIANDINGLITNLNSVEEKIAVFRAGMSTGVNSNTTALPQDGTLLNSEVFSFIEKLNALNIKEDAESKIIRLKTILQSLNEIGKVKTGNVNIKSITGVADDFNKIFELATALELLISQLEKIQSLSLSEDLLSGLKVSSANVKNMNMMADALKNISESLNIFKADSVGVLNSISEITKQIEGLKNLNNILKSGKKVSETVRDSELKRTEEGATSSKTKKDKESVDKLTNSYKSLSDSAEEYFNLLLKKSSGDLNSLNQIKKLKELEKNFFNAYNKSEDFNWGDSNLNDIYDEFILNSQNGFDSAKKRLIDNLKPNIDEFKLNLSNDDVVNIDVYKKRLSEIESLIEEIEKLTFDGILNGESDDFNHLNQYLSKFDELVSDLKTSKEFKPVDPERVAAETGKISKWLIDNTKAPIYIRKEIAGILDTINNVDNQADFKKLLTRFKELDAEVKATGKSGNSFFTSWSKKMEQLGTYITSFGSFYKFIEIFKRGIQTIREYDTVLTEMRKVSNETTASLKKYQTQSFDTANEVGTTAKVLQQSTADWLRLGEAMDEASESAKASAILYNVSEFEGIDAATESLVSISQAYKNLEKMDIVDKINYIGNNYAIATDQLATGLQNASAALTTQGNDLDEAIALITAGNIITQDADKTSAGIRTISLRISGTEEAKEELESLGEDTEGVVQTRSKLNETIKNYTAVASNEGKGISILDDNGNLRNTYEILLDISKIYKEIQEEDKKYGTNRASALVETLAGKNRSNIAASILLNPETLESVYEDSKNKSKGSAEKENEKQLESLENHFTRLQNSADKFWTTFINSDVVKFVTKVLDVLLKWETTLTETVGTIPQIVGLITTIKSIKGEG